MPTWPFTSGTKRPTPRSASSPSWKKKTLTATIREAVEHEYEQKQKKLPLLERLKPLHEWLDGHSKPGGLLADKAFYDELSGEDELTGLP